MSEINNDYAPPVDIFALGQMGSISQMGVKENTAGPLQFTTPPPAPPPVDSNYSPVYVTENYGPPAPPVVYDQPPAPPPQGSGNDIVQGAAGNDDLNGFEGDDTVYGNEGDDQARGGKGNDAVYGGKGNDRVYGDNGDDRLSGDRGDDSIDGGEGYDTANFSGSIDNYSVTQEGGGFRITDKRGDADGSDFVTNVENFSFGGQSFSADGLIQAAMPKPVVVAPPPPPVVVAEPPVTVAPPPPPAEPVPVLTPAPVSVAAPSAQAQLGWSDEQALAYVASYPDLRKAFGANPGKGAEHYVNHGKGENRTTSFDPQAYLAANPDVKAVYGPGSRGALEHYFQYGQFENRQGTGAAAATAAATTAGAETITGQAGIKDELFFGSAGGDQLALDPTAGGKGGGPLVGVIDLPEDGVVATYNVTVAEPPLTFSAEIDEEIASEPSPGTSGSSNTMSAYAGGDTGSNGGIGGGTMFGGIGTSTGTVGSTSGGQSGTGSANEAGNVVPKEKITKTLTLNENIPAGEAGGVFSISYEPGGELVNSVGSDEITGSAGNDLLAVTPPKTNPKNVSLDQLGAGLTGGPFPPVNDVNKISNAIDGASDYVTLGIGVKKFIDGEPNTSKISTNSSDRIDIDKRIELNSLQTIMLPKDQLLSGDIVGALKNAIIFMSIPIPFQLAPQELTIRLADGAFQFGSGGAIDSYGQGSVSKDFVLSFDTPNLKNNAIKSSKHELGEENSKNGNILFEYENNKDLNQFIFDFIYKSVQFAGTKAPDDFRNAFKGVLMNMKAMLTANLTSMTVDKSLMTTYAGRTGDFDINPSNDNKKILLNIDNNSVDITKTFVSKPEKIGSNLSQAVGSLSSYIRTIYPSNASSDLDIDVRLPSPNDLRDHSKLLFSEAITSKNIDKQHLSSIVSQFLNAGADAFSFAQVTKQIWENKANSVTVRTNADKMYNVDDGRMKVARAFITSFYGTSLGGKEVSFANSTPKSRALWFQGDKLIGYNSLNNFGELTAANIPLVLGSAQKFYNKPGEFAGRLAAFTEQLVRLGYSNLNFGSKLVADANIIARTKVNGPAPKIQSRDFPDFGQNAIDAQRMKQYFVDGILPGGFKNWIDPSLLSPKKADAPGDTNVADADGDGFFVGNVSNDNPVGSSGKDDLGTNAVTNITLAPELAILSDDEIANFATAPTTKGFASDVAGLLSVPSTHREAYYVSGAGKEQKMPDDIVKLRKQRQEIIDRYEASPKSFFDLLNAVRERINFEPGMGEIVYAYLVANGIPIPDATSPNNFISLMPVSAKPMTQQEALAVLGKLPGTTVENGVLSNEYLPDKSFAAEGLNAATARKIADTIAQYDLAPGQNPSPNTFSLLNPGLLAGGAKPPAPPTDLALAPGPKDDWTTLDLSGDYPTWGVAGSVVPGENLPTGPTEAEILAQQSAQTIPNFIANFDWDAWEKRT